MFVGVVFGVIGAAILVVGIVILVRERSFVRGAANAQGTVIGSNPMTSTDDDGMSTTNYHAVVQFTTGGKQYDFTDPLGTDPPRYSEGDTVTVKYDLARPEHAQIESALRQWGLPTFLILFGGLFFGLGIVALLVF